MNGLIRIESLEPYDWAYILRDGRSEGYNMVNRLISDFKAGINRFDARGETLFAHVRDTAVVAVAGLNREEIEDFGKAGRVRRLYVSPEYRGAGLGRSLVEELISFAATFYDSLTVNTGKLRTRSFYEHLGFQPVDLPGITHVRRLK